MQKKSGLKVESFSETLRGEAPREGVPTFVIDVRDEGKSYESDNIVDMAVQGIGEVVTIIGKPFRQVDAVSDLVGRISQKRKVIIETSGRVEWSSISDRSIFVPIVNHATIVLKPSYGEIDPKQYEWIRKYRFTSLYFKFQWAGSESRTGSFINDFFGVVGLSSFEYISNSKVIIMPGDASNEEECRSAWMFCEKFCMRYSSREFQRLWQKEIKK